jgi:hypothetical protein
MGRQIICKGCGNIFDYTGTSKTRQYCNIKCSNNVKNLKKKYSKEEFIAKANIKHDSKFDYTLIDLSNDKIKILCPIHGEFTQEKSSHLLGKGCKACANNKGRKTAEQFIAEAKKIHGEKYNYANVNYVNNATNVEIICPTHGAFWQLPFQHTNLKSGCSECIKNIRVSIGEKKWLDKMGVPEDDLHRQVYINLNGKKMWVDGLNENTVYEYLGDYWHGNPNLYSGSEINKSAKKSYGELYDETLQRFSNLEKQGYIVKYIWESEWLKTKN